MPGSLQQARADRLRQKRPKPKTVQSQLLSLAMAVMVVVLLLLCARFVTVLILSLREDPAFIAPKTIYLPQRELDHAMAVAEFQNAAASPVTVPTLTTESLLASAPALPEIPNVDFTPVESEAVVTEADALFGQAGLMGALGALSSQASSVSFLGIREEAARFVIVIDVSTSTVNAVEAAGSSMQAIKNEAQELIQNLNANTLFNLVLHSRGYRGFQNSLVPATVSNKQAAKDWLDRWFESTPPQPPPERAVGDMRNGIVVITDFVFDMQPDVIFMLSDGGYFTTLIDGNQRPVTFRELDSRINERQRDLPTNARIHFIHFPDPRNIQDGRIGRDMRRITTSNQGQFRVMSR
jgi:hypothetical protein